MQLHGQPIDSVGRTFDDLDDAAVVVKQYAGDAVALIAQPDIRQQIRDLGWSEVALALADVNKLLHGGSRGRDDFDGYALRLPDRGQVGRSSSERRDST